MRTMLRISMDINAANEAIRTGALQQVFQNLAQEIKPEATYYTAEGGKRTAYYFFQLNDSSQIPRICEPLFTTLGAEIDLKPVMNAAELAKGLEGIPTSKAA